MVNEHLITADMFVELARPTSRHIDHGEVETFVRECEDVHIIPAIGLERFKALLGARRGEADATLLDGGEFKDASGTARRCFGLRRALAYFVYAKMAMADGGMLTRSGLTRHNDSYATREDGKGRARRYNDVMEIAETYLGSCLAFMKSVEGDGVRPARGTRVRIHAIGE